METEGQRGVFVSIVGTKFDALDRDHASILRQGSDERAKETASSLQIVFITIPCALLCSWSIPWFKLLNVVASPLV
jgi:hypothetical protein